MAEKTYIAIDLKSFYASVECVERGLNPLSTNLVVADKSRTDKTICLAVSPSLKKYGIPGRARLFEVVQKVRQVNADRQYNAPSGRLIGSSVFDDELTNDPSLAVDYITASPRMAYYMQYSKRVYGIYLKYIAPEDIHVYSIDEVFIDATAYLASYKMSARQLAATMIHDVLENTGITATAGIGPNMYLCKIAMDVEAKHIIADSDGVRIAELDEMSYRQKYWNYTPITDFWRIGKGYAKRLASYGMYTMGDVAKCSVGAPSDFYNEELLYRIFGVNAELLIDHAWGWEPCTIADIKSYTPSSRSISQGQVLTRPYSFPEGRLAVKEMADMLSLDLVYRGYVSKQIVLTVCYDIENLAPGKDELYDGEIVNDFYGRPSPKPAHASFNLDRYTSSSTQLIRAFAQLYDSIVNPALTIRRIYVVANDIIRDGEEPAKECEQLDFFTDYEARELEESKIRTEMADEKEIQKTILEIKQKYGKNAILRGMNFEEGATAKDRNRQIGGHKA